MSKLNFIIQDSTKRSFIYEDYMFKYNENEYETLYEYALEMNLYKIFNNNFSFKVSWKYFGKKHQIFFPNGNAHFLVDQISGLIVCKHFTLKGKFIKNTCFLNLNNTINHILEKPSPLYCCFEDGLRVQYKPLAPPSISEDKDPPLASFLPVDDVHASIYFDKKLNSLIGHYYFNYEWQSDWLLYRKYDAIQRKWGEVIGHSGHIR